MMGANPDMLKSVSDKNCVEEKGETLIKPFQIMTVADCNVKFQVEITDKIYNSYRSTF
jgi:hypothetical protein